MLEPPHPAGPAVAALDLVRDEQDPVLVTETAEFPEERRGRRVVAALALDWLDQDRPHGRWRDRGRRQRPKVGHRDGNGRSFVTTETPIRGGERRQVDRREHRLVPDPVV